MLHSVEIFSHSSTTVVGGHHVDILRLGSKHHECHAKHCVGTSGEDFQFDIAISHFEAHFGTFRATDPVFLSFFQRVCPVDLVKTIEQALSISRHAETPLIHQLLLHRIAATHADTLAHLIVGKHSAELRTPVDHRLALISDAIVHKALALLFFRESVPLFGSECQLLRASDIQALRAMLLEVSDKFGHRARLL